MKYFKYKRLMKKRKAFSNIEIFFGAFLDRFADADRKMLLTFLYNVNRVITLFTRIAPIFVYGTIYYFHSYIEPFINPYYVATLYLIISIWFTEINNDDYDPIEFENIAQWMYKASNNKFKLLVLGRLLRTFGINILFYCILIFIYMSKWQLGYVILGIFLASLVISLKFLWSNYQIFSVFVYGPNEMKRKEEYVRRKRYDLNRNKYHQALARSCQNRTYYLNISYTYIFAVALPLLIWFVTAHFTVHKYLIITIYLAAISVLASFISQGIINGSKMLNRSNLSDYYYIKKFDKKNYYEHLLTSFLSRRLIVILISYYVGLFILYGFSLVTAIFYVLATVIYFNAIKIITKRVFRFDKLSIEEIENNFFVYFFNPIEDLVVIGFPIIISSAVAIYSMELGSSYPIIIFFLAYSIGIFLYNFLKER